MRCQVLNVEILLVSLVEEVGSVGKGGTNEGLFEERGFDKPRQFDGFEFGLVGRGLFLLEVLPFKLVEFPGRLLIGVVHVEGE